MVAPTSSAGHNSQTAASSARQDWSAKGGALSPKQCPEWIPRIDQAGRKPDFGEKGPGWGTSECGTPADLSPHAGPHSAFGRMTAG